MAPKVLVVLTSQSKMNNGHPTGWYLPEFAHPYYDLVNNGVEITPLLEGREATGFSNSEEEAVKLTSAMPVLLEDEIKRVGGKYVKADDWAEKLAVDGQVITGQNPASAHAVGKAILKAIGA
ncbi:NonF protein, involved in nonactin biosynthesis [Fusarium fujikuroi]|nr:NonF protein, involved in nonactin biosynthesis [Fusarium fujikuroi]